MRISKATLWSRWARCTIAGLAVFAILAALDTRLKALSGLGTADLQSLSTAAQFHAVTFAWGSPDMALRAGFNLGIDYLLMPLYAASFFYSGIITAEHFAPQPGRLRRILLLAAMVPFAGALCDAAENALEITLLLGGGNDLLARIAFAVSNAKTVALTVGGVLLLGALSARFAPRKKPEGPEITL